MDTTSVQLARYPGDGRGYVRHRDTPESAQDGEKAERKVRTPPPSETDLAPLDAMCLHAYLCTPSDICLEPSALGGRTLELFWLGLLKISYFLSHALPRLEGRSCNGGLTAFQCLFPCRGQKYFQPIKKSLALPAEIFSYCPLPAFEGTGTAPKQSY